MIPSRGIFASRSIAFLLFFLALCFVLHCSASPSSADLSVGVNSSVATHPSSPSPDGAHSSELFTVRSVLSTAVGVVTALLVYSFWDVNRRPSGFPPGPSGLPVLGNMVQLLPFPTIEFSRMSKQFRSPVIGLRLGQVLAVAVNDADTIHQVLGSMSCAGRPLIETFRFSSARYQDLLGSSAGNARWKQQRQTGGMMFTHASLHRPETQAVTQSKIAWLMRQLEAHADQNKAWKKPFHLLLHTTAAIIANILFGIDFNYSDPTSHKVLETLSDFFDQLNRPPLSDFIPWVKYVLVHEIFYHRKTRQIVTYLKGWIRGHFEAHQRKLLLSKSENNNTSNSNDKNKSFCEFVLQQQQLKKAKAGAISSAEVAATSSASAPASAFAPDGDEEQENEKEYASGSSSRSRSTPSFLSDHHLTELLTNLFNAGPDTSATTLEWGVLMMVNYPDIQARLYAEIQSVCGGACPTAADSDKLPYLQCFIKEVMRYRIMSPTSLPHMAIEPFTIVNHKTGDRYDIPTNCLLFTNLHGMNHDPAAWTEPHIFNPDRFLTLDPKLEAKIFLPFSAGPRACLGRPLAQIMLFSVLSQMVWNFELSRPENQKEKYTEEGVYGLAVYHCTPFDVKVSKRKH